MSYKSSCFLILLAGFIAMVLVGCSRDPNVRKLKYLESGHRYFEKGKYREAVIQFSNAIQTDSRYGDAYYERAKTRLKLQEWGAAYKDLSRVLDLQPGNYRARLDLANLLILGRDFTQAQEHTNLLLQQDGNNAQVHVAAADLLAAQQDFSGAIQQTQRAVGLSPDQWELYLRLAMLQMRTNQTDQAEISFKKAVELGPGASGALLALGGYYQSRSRYAEAEQQFRHAIDSDPTNPDSCLALVRLYMIQGKKDQAESFLKQNAPRFPGNSVGYRMLGDFYFAAGELDQATAEYASLYREHPKDVQVKKNYIQLLILGNRLDDARKLNNEMLKTSATDTDALIDRAQIQVREGRPSDAIGTLHTVIKNEPGSGVAHYHLGIAFDAAGDLQQAQSEFQEAVRLQPDLYEAQKALVAAALRRGNMSALEQTADQIITLQPQSPEGYLIRSACTINRKQFVRAEADIRKAMELAPQSPEAYIQLGNLRFAQQQFTDAGNSYQQALDRDPRSANALGGIMNAYLAQKQPDKAISAARGQIVKVPDSSAFYDLLGTQLFDIKKDMGGAEAAFEKAADLDKNNADALLKLGQLQVAKGSNDEAIATYLNSAKNNPREPSFYILLGEIYEATQDWEKAREMYQKALQIRPGSPLASNNLAYVMVQTGGNVDLALDLAQNARRSMPDSPNAADTLGWVFYQKGAFNSAIDLFQEALRLGERNRAPENATFHYHLALAYEKTDHPALAKQQFQRVLKINPNYSDAATVKKELAQL